MKYEEIRKQVIAENENICVNVLEYINADDGRLERESTRTRWDQYQNGKISRDELVAFTTKRIEKYYQKRTAQDLERLEQIENAETPEEIVIRVEWKRNSHYGNNPHAEVTDDHRRWTGSTPVASGGYDKRTAAIADAANQSNRILKILADKKERELQAGKTGENRDLVGYGSGYSAIPKFEGGVGIESYRTMFENCGYEWKDYSGEKYDLYIATKKEV